MSYWGNHTSLYIGLPPKGIQTLEKAIRFQVRGEYADALKSFTLLDEPLLKLPAVLIEHAILYDRMGLVQEQLKLLNAVKHPLPVPRQEPGADEWDLINQLRTSADLFANGKLDPALSQACLIATQLKPKRTDDFSDIEVHCEPQCWRIFSYCIERSNYLDVEYANVLKGFLKVSEVRGTFQDQGRFSLGQSLVQHEKQLEDYNPGQTLCAYESFLEAFSAPAFAQDASEPARYKLALTHLFYAEALVLAAKGKESLDQLEIARQFLRKDIALSQPSTVGIPPTAQLLISKIRAKSGAPATAMDRKDQSLSCASEAEVLQDWPVYREHVRDALLHCWEAKETGDLETRVAGAKDYFRILKKYIEFEDGFIHSGLFLAHGIGRFGVAASQQGGSQLEHFLDMVQAYEQNFPDLSVPLIITNLAISTSEAARCLGDMPTFQRYRIRQREWNDKCPWMMEKSGKFVLKDDLPDKFSFKRWAYKYEDPNRGEMANLAMYLILRWVKREMQENELSEKEVEGLIQWARLRESFILESYFLPQNVDMDALPCTAPDKLCGMLFNAQKPIEPEVWDPWFSNLKSWLQRNRLPSRLQRLNLLKEVQVIRCCHLLHYIMSFRPPTLSLPHQELWIKEEKRSLLLHQEILLTEPEAFGEFKVRAQRSQYAAAISVLAFTRGTKEKGSLTDDLIREAVDIYEALTREWAAGDELSGAPIIERNPVAYIQSTSLLRFILQPSEQADARKESTLRAVIFNTLSNDPKAIRSVRKLNDTLGGLASIVSHCTKENFAQLGAEAGIIHTHGHIVFDPDDPLPLKHHLVLGHPDNDPKNQLTADEICDIKFRRGALIMAMGCNSDRARQSDCDDLLGLTAAFHCAGAGTVVSTLWMIDADDCVQFAGAFYAYLVSQLRASDDGSGSVDLAVAMQKGVAAVRFDGVGRERDPYHWAGFVLHGSWKFARRRLLFHSAAFASD